MKKLEKVFESKGYVEMALALEKKISENIISDFINSKSKTDFSRGYDKGVAEALKLKNRAIKNIIKANMGVM